MTWIFLGVAIVAEIIATALLPRSNGFRRLRPSVVVILLYGLAFFFLAQTLRTLDLGIAYALWAGIGTAVIAVIGVALLNESASPKKLVGIVCIVGGVILLNLGGGL